MTFAAGDVGALVRGYASGSVDDAVMERWLRSVFERGMSVDETYELTLAMALSGDVIDWSGAGLVVDKHSTGGVGDAVTLIAVPLAAACGARVAKLSGRALGHTGGTIDKLECVPGLRTDLPVGEFRAIVERIGCAVAAASANLAPADKRLYALRHRTGLVASVPLIAASVMSKKIAAGAGAIVLDVKFGSGAFVESRDEARRLADTMCAIGERAGRRMSALLTDMSTPLADSVGDALELDEALAIMEGKGGSDRLRDAALSVAGAMTRAAGLTDADPARALADGDALEKFRAMTAAQGGSLDGFARSWPGGLDVKAAVDGVIERIDARIIGEAVADAKGAAGSGSASRVGVRLRTRVGARVLAGDAVLTCWLPREDPRLARAVSLNASAGGSR